LQLYFSSVNLVMSFYHLIDIGVISCFLGYFTRIFLRLLFKEYSWI
jgi:hypothetical protein